MKKVFILLVIVPALSCRIIGQTEQDFHAEVLNTYSFTPHLLNEVELAERAKVMDRLWNNVKGDPSRYLPLLRAELRSTSDPSFFYFDGGQLLIRISPTISDKRLALSASLKADLQDVDRTQYVYYLNEMALAGLNTTEAALRVIDEEDFWGYVPQHAMTMERDEALIFGMLPVATEEDIQRVVDRLPLIKDTACVKQVIEFLWYACTCAADSAIHAVAVDPGVDGMVRAFAAKADGARPLLRSQHRSKYTRFSKERVRILSRVSDEALYELDDLARKMKRVYACGP